MDRPFPLAVAIVATLVATSTVVPPVYAGATSGAAIADLALRHAETIARSESGSTCGQSPNRRSAGIVAALFGGVIAGLPMSIIAKRHADQVDGWRRCYGVVVELKNGSPKLLADLDSHRHAAQTIKRLDPTRVLAVFNDRHYSRCGAVAKSVGGKSRIYVGVASTASGAEKEAIKACRYVSGAGVECRVEIDGTCNAWIR
ncbi:MAG: hypothetical protein OXQ90_19230 [Gammaproteobacteria bacterium]|nr:hypothetical protein [Gammaproteobacteria bacterium]